MAEDQEKKDEEKFEFTAEGEALGYIGMDQAQVRAMQVATETPGDYGPAYAGIRMAFEVVSAQETEDHYVITLSLRPQGDLSGRTGQEQFFIEKEGGVAHRQVLVFPRRGRRFPVIPVAIGLAVAGVVAVIAVLAVAGLGGGADSQPGDTEAQVVVPPTTTAPVAPITTAPVPSTPTFTPVPTTATFTPVPPSPAPKNLVGTAVISDSNDGKSATMSDVITYTLNGVTLPGQGFAYEGWLVSDDGSERLSTGVMAVDGSGAITHVFTSPWGDNLIRPYNRVVITLEPVPDDDPGPSGVVIFDEIPQGGMAHIRHLLTSWPPGESRGILTNLKLQLDLAILHANLAKNSDTLEDVRLHTHHVINIIEGVEGSNFDIRFGNPGDGVGVLAHARDRKHGGLAAASAADDTEIVAGAKLVVVTGANAENWAAQARDVALNNVLIQANITLAKEFLGPGRGGTVITFLENARNGFDTDQDDTIESVVGEGGADQAYVAAQAMATYRFRASAE